MNLQETMLKITEIFPNATIGEDSDGQLIIYTDMEVVKHCTEDGTEMILEPLIVGSDLFDDVGEKS